MHANIENFIKRGDWLEARRLVAAALDKTPDSHWLITRLALTYYEEREYERSLVLELRARELAPHCPLVLWDLAGTFQMLNRFPEAVVIYRRLLRRGVKAVAFGPCGEGVAWARGLLADCWYRLAQCHQANGRRLQALRCYQRHLASRGPGCRSIYRLEDVRHEMAIAAAGNPTQSSALGRVN